MQITASIESKHFSIQKEAEFEGWKVPWEVSAYADDFQHSEKLGGAFDLSFLNCITLAGSDAKDFLQRMSTADFKKMVPGNIRYGAFLTGKGTVVGLGTFILTEREIEFWVTPSQTQAVLEHIEKFHFAEKFEVKDTTQDKSLIGVWNPTPGLRDEFQIKSDFPVQQLEWRRWRSMDCDMWRDSVRQSLYFVRVRRSQCPHFLEHLNEVSVPLLGQKLFEYFRIQAGVPQVGPEANLETIILETGFDEAVARNKGCYPGQEVVERIFTYGSVNKKLMPVQIRGHIPAVPQPLLSGGKEIGRLVTAMDTPGKADSGVGLAFLHKDYWSLKDTAFTF